MKQFYTIKSTLFFAFVFLLNFSLLANASANLNNTPTKPYLPFLVDATADVQFIHNSSDPALEEVDVYVNGDLVQANFSYRTATSFLSLPADEDLAIAIALGGSNSANEAFYNTTLNLIPNEKYIAVANGVQNTAFFNTTVNSSIEFNLNVFEGARENAIAIAGNTDILVYHGVTDFPDLNITETNIPLPNFITDLSFTEFNPYIQIATNNYVIQPEFSDGSNPLDVYDLPLSDLGLQNKAVTLLTSGFLEPENNQDGAEFSLWIAVPEGGELIQLPFTGNCVAFGTPLFENFSGEGWEVGTGFQNTGNTINDCWSRETTSTTTQEYAWGTGNSGTSFFNTGTTSPFNGSNFVIAQPQGATGSQATLTSPIISTNNLTTPALSFYYYMFGSAIGSLEVQVKEFSSPNWISLLTLNGQQQTGPNQDWIQQEIDLPDFQNKNIQIRFIATRGNGFASAIQLDAFEVREAPTCIRPTNVEISEISTNSAQVSWNAQSNSISWFVYNDGDDPQTSTPVAEGTADENQTSTTLTGLTEGTTYQVYLQTNCETEDSDLTLPVQFSTTLCEVQEQCAYTFNLSDSFGDGWNGNIVELRQGGVLIANLGEEFTSGNSFTEEYNLCDGATIELIWLNTGSFANEVGLNVVDSFGDEVYELPFNSASEQGSTLVNFNAACTPPSCPKVTDITLTNILSESAQINWESVDEASEGYTWFIFNEGANPNTASALQSESVAEDVTSVTVTNLNPAESYDVYVKANCINNEDSDFSDVVNFFTPCATIIAPYLEDFNSSLWQVGTGFLNTGDEISPCWSANSDGHRWGVRTGQTSLSNSGPNEAFLGSNYIYSVGPSGANGAQAFITSPPIDISNLTNPGITFFYHMFGANIGTLELEVKSVTSSNWQSLFSIEGQQQSSEGDNWEEAIVSLESFENEIIEYRFIATRGNGIRSEIAVDAIDINEVNPCLRPTNLEISNQDLESVTLSWNSGGSSVISYTWEVYLLNENPEENEPVVEGTVDASTTTVDIAGLASGTQYEAYVIAVCEDNENSNYSFPAEFATQTCAAADTCAYTFTLTDSFGDGWNGNTMSVFQNEELVQVLGESFTNGNELIETVNLCSDAAIELFWNEGGSFANEVGVIITNPFEEEIYTNQPGEGSQNSTLFSFTSDCDLPDGCFSPNGFQVDDLTTNSVELSWENIGSAISGYNWFIFNEDDDPFSATPIANGSTNFEENTVLVSGLSDNTAYKAFIRSDCGFTGVSPISDPIFFQTPCGFFEAPFTEDFEGNQWSPPTPGPEAIADCWSRNPDFQFGSYSWLTASSSLLNNPEGDNFLLNDGAFGNPGDTATIELPAIDLSNLTEPSLSYFYLITGSEIGHSVEIKTDDAEDWETLIAYTESAQSSDNEEFIREVVDLAAYQNQIVNIRFVAVSGSSSSDIFAIDFIQIDEIPECESPLNLSINNIETTQAELSFENEDLAINGYNWYVFPTGEEPNTEEALFTGNTQNELNIILANLSPATTYDVYVESVCLNDEISELSLPVTFSTAVCEEEDTCDFDFTLSSEAGNGWNGASVQVFQEGILIATLGNEFISGNESVVTLSLCVDSPTEVVWNEGGTSPDNLAISLVNSFNEELYNSDVEEINVGDTLFSFTTSCEPPVCPIPQNIEVSEITQTTASISWNTVESALEGYNWFIFAAGSNPEIDEAIAEGTTPSDETSVGVSGLDLATDYDVYVQANCEFNESELNLPVPFSTFGECEPPLEISIDDLSSSEITISWPESEIAFNGYNWSIFEEGEDPETNTPLFNGTVEGESSLTISGLVEDTAYDFYLVSDCDFAISPLSPPLNFTTLICLPPTAIEISEITFNSVAFNWDLVPEVGEGGYTYFVHFEGEGPDPETALLAFEVDENTSTGFIENLEPFTSYELYVQSNCEFGDAATSEAVQFTTPEPPCDVPANISISEITNNQALLSWDEVEFATNGYSWFLFEAGADPEVDLAVDFGETNFGETSVVLEDLLEDTAYEAYILSDCDFAMSETSNPIAFTTSNACNTPLGLTASVISGTGVTLNWESSETAINGFNWYIFENGANPETAEPVAQGQTNTDENSVEVNGLLEIDTAYQAYVESVCEFETSNLSGAVNFTTLTNECQPAQDLQVFDIQQTSVTFSWNPSEEPAGIYTYLITEVDGNDSFEIEGLVDANQGQFSVTGLSPTTTYNLVLSLVCENEAVSTTDPVLFTTLNTTELPPNDDLCNAIFIPEFEFVFGDNTNGTLEDNEPIPSCFEGEVNSTVWFSFEATSVSNDNVIVNPTDGQTITNIALYEAPEDCENLDELIELGCTTGEEFGAVLSPSGLTPGELYFVQVSFAGENNDGTFSITNQPDFSNEDFDDFKFSLYPNPAKHLLHIEAIDLIEEVTVHNMLGQKVIQRKHNRNKLSLPVGNLSAGKYFVKIKVNGKTYIESFLKG